MKFITGIFIGCLFSYVVMEYKVISYKGGIVKLDTKKVQRTIQKKIK